MSTQRPLDEFGETGTGNGDVFGTNSSGNANRDPSSRQESVRLAVI